MLYEVYRFLSKTHRFVLLVLAVVLIFGCNQKGDNETSKDSVKLDVPLNEVLPKITLILPEETDSDENPIEITVGSTYSGTGEYGIGGGETAKYQYTLFDQHTVEGNKYIYTVVSYNLGGSGTFYYLTAVDKKTLKSVHQVLLGDRVEIVRVNITVAVTGLVSVVYMNRESGTSMSEKPDKQIEKHFQITENQFHEKSVAK